MDVATRCLEGARNHSTPSTDDDTRRRLPSAIKHSLTTSALFTSVIKTLRLSLLTFATHSTIRVATTTTSSNRHHWTRNRKPTSAKDGQTPRFFCADHLPQSDNLTPHRHRTPHARANLSCIRWLTKRLHRLSRFSNQPTTQPLLPRIQTPCGEEPTYPPDDDTSTRTRSPTRSGVAKSPSRPRHGHWLASQSHNRGRSHIDPIPAPGKQ